MTRCALLFALSLALNVQAQRIVRREYILEPNASLIGADLHQLDLEGINLTRAYAQKANLEWSDLTGATLVETNFEGANCSTVNFSGANLTGARFNYAFLNASNFTGATVTNAQFTCLLSGAPWTMPVGYKWEEDTDCVFVGRYRMVPE